MVRATAIGCARAGLLASSFAEEAEADLFNEQAVVWGGVPELLTAGFETLVEAGIRPEIAYLECVGELKLIAELIEARGIAGMREAISNTAELSAHLGGGRVIDANVRQRMADILREIREGRFANELTAEAASQVDTSFQWSPITDFVYQTWAAELPNVASGQSTLVQAMQNLQTQTVQFATDQGFTVTGP